VHFIEADLASLASVKAASENFLSQCDQLDLLICNAGIMSVPPNLTKDGYEVQFGTNHLGHALLIQKLLPLLLHDADKLHEDKRIVILTSSAYRGHPCGGILFDKLKTTQDSGPLGPGVRYGQSKLANILYASEIARRYPDITSVSVHPGIIKTNLIDGMGPAMRILVKATMTRLEPEEGAYNTLWASFTKRSVISNGAMYEPVGVQTELNKTAMDAALAKKLWEWTERELRRFM
jgi:NAD(P)-dependent dehydrogenase (short-subunit alcohol dehydrogenase family)